MYKFFAYLNGLKDGVLTVLLPLSFLTGCIVMVISILVYPEIREPMMLMAEKFNNEGENHTTNYKVKKKAKVKMGFNLD